MRCSGGQIAYLAGPAGLSLRFRLRGPSSPTTDPIADMHDVPSLAKARSKIFISANRHANGEITFKACFWEFKSQLLPHAPVLTARMTAAWAPRAGLLKGVLAAVFVGSGCDAITSGQPVAAGKTKAAAQSVLSRSSAGLRLRGGALSALLTPSTRDKFDRRVTNPHDREIGGSLQGEGMGTHAPGAQGTPSSRRWVSPCAGGGAEGDL